MCIRDSYNTMQKDTSNSEKEAVEFIYRQLRNAEPPDYETCLLYTSDAADERSSVDLGGRRIIKTNTTVQHKQASHMTSENMHTSPLQTYIISTHSTTK